MTVIKHFNSIFLLVLGSRAFGDTDTSEDWPSLKCHDDNFGRERNHQLNSHCERREHSKDCKKYCIMRSYYDMRPASPCMSKLDCFVVYPYTIKKHLDEDYSSAKNSEKRSGDDDLRNSLAEKIADECWKCVGMIYNETFTRKANEKEETQRRYITLSECDRSYHAFYDCIEKAFCSHVLKDGKVVANKSNKNI